MLPMLSSRRLMLSRRQIQKIAGSFLRCLLGPRSSGSRTAWFLCRLLFGMFALRVLLPFLEPLALSASFRAVQLRVELRFVVFPPHLTEFFGGFGELDWDFFFLRGALSLWAPCGIFCCILQLRCNFSLDEIPIARRWASLLISVLSWIRSRGSSSSTSMTTSSVFCLRSVACTCFLSVSARSFTVAWDR